jgi:TonB family protein
MIQNKITMNWKEPPKPSLDSKDLSAVVSFTILRDGQVQKISLVEASSMQSLNQTVLEAVKVSSPLPPLPADFAGNQLNVKIKFELSE